MRRTLVAALVVFACKTPAEQQTTAARAMAPAAPAAGTMDPSTVVATVGTDKITAADLDKIIGGKVRQEEADHQQKMYELRENALEGEVAGRLIKADAKAHNLSEEDYVKMQMNTFGKETTDVEAKAFFDKNPQQMQGRTFEQIKEPLKQYLGRQGKQKAMMDLVEDLKKKTKVSLNLPAPVLPRIDVAATGPERGNKDAPVTIVEFSDFQCPYCGREIAVVDQVMKEFDGKVKLYFRHFPLPFHEHAEKAAEAAVCAQEVGGDAKFWALHDKMFNDQQHLGVAELKGKAKDAGIDSAKFDACLDSGKHADDVKKDQKAGEEAGVNGTPAFFVNGQLVSGAQPFEKFKDAIERELKRIN